jgi:preprotein translocase subunit SecY
VIQGIGNITKITELRNRIIFVLAMLAVYRLGCHLPTPGIDARAMAQFFERGQGTLFGMFNLFSGGALENMSVFSLGIMPYITASIILQLLTVVFPTLERLSKEGEVGRKKITQYTRYLTVCLAAIQAIGIAVWMEQMEGMSVVSNPGWAFRLSTVLTLTAGTSFLMWIGEQMTEKGIGNGISILIYAGIVAGMPSAIILSYQQFRIGEMTPFRIIFLLVFMVVVIGVIVYVERGQRRIPIQYAKQVRGRRIVGGQGTFLPLKVNTAGVIPPIFASSLLMFPLTLANFAGDRDNPVVDWVLHALTPTHPVYNIVYVVGIIFFCYFYTAVQFNPVDVADNLRRYGGYIPGIRPGKKTSDYIDKVLTRITLWGALYVSVVCVLPQFLMAFFNIQFYFGGTSILIVVGVALDTAQQVEAHLLTRNYDGFLGPKGPKLKGRRR